MHGESFLLKFILKIVTLDNLDFGEFYYNFCKIELNFT